MHLSGWLNDADFDRFEYLVPVLFLFLFSAVQWVWRYWHRESKRARYIVLSLLTTSGVCLLLWTGLGRRPLWLLLVGLAIGPVAVLLRMQASWMNYQGPPETLQRLPPALEELDRALMGEDEPPKVPPHQGDAEA